MQTTKRIVWATALITTVALLVKGLGFAEKLLLAYFFGTGIQVDAYLVAYSLPFSAYIVLREVVKPAFLPVFLRLRRTDEKDAWRLFGTVGTLLFLLLGPATVAAIFLAEPLIALAAPGFGGEQRLLAVRLTRLIMPALLLLGLSTLTTAALHADKRFLPPAVGDMSFRAGPLLLLMALGGVPALALGAVLGALGKLLIEAGSLGKGLRRVRPALDPAFAPVRTVGKLAAPLLAALFLSLFIGPLVENAFASKAGVGGVSALAYARKIAETLTAILPYTLGLVLFPFSAEMAARRDGKALARTLDGAVRALTLLFLPTTVGLLLLHQPFIRLLFERGAFDAASTQLTAGPLAFYALALLPFALEVVVIQFFFARQDTLTPVLTDAAAFALNVVLIPPLMAALGLGGIALAAAIAKGLKVFALLFLFERRVPAFRLKALRPFAGRMALACLATAAVLAALQAMVARSEIEGLGPLAAYLSLAGLLGGVTFFGASFLLGVEEVRNLAKQGTDWIRARQG